MAKEVTGNFEVGKETLWKAQELHLIVKSGWSILCLSECMWFGRKSLVFGIKQVQVQVIAHLLVAM